MDPITSQIVESDFTNLLKNHIKNNRDIIYQLKFFKNIISQLNIAIFIHNLKKLNHTWTNNNYYKIIGYTDDELKKMGPDWAKKNYHPDDFHIVSDRIEYFRKNKGDAYSGIYRIKHKKGHWVWV